MRRASVIATALIGLALLVPGCSSGSKSTGTSARAVVEIRGTALHPAKVTIKAGGTVTWKFVDHGVVHDIEGAIFGSGRKSKGDYKFTFPNAGTSTYHCTIHPDMKGVVSVKAN
jgi:plastocyanin